MPKSSKKTLTVSIEGRTFSRTTERTYTHVLVGCWDRDRRRAEAYGWTAAEEKAHLDFVKHLGERADGSWWPKNGFEFRAEYDAPKQAQDIATLSRGSDAIREEAKQAKIDQFLRWEAEGRFEPHVVSWHGSEKAARSALTTLQNHGFYARLQAVAVADAQPASAVCQLGDLLPGTRYVGDLGVEYLVTSIPTDYDHLTWVVNTTTGTGSQQPNSLKLTQTGGTWKSC